jgi:hypothetical protein
MTELDAVEREFEPRPPGPQVVARLGVIATRAQGWTGAAADRRYVAMNRPVDYSEPVWDFVVEHAVQAHPT